MRSSIAADRRGGFRKRRPLPSLAPPLHPPPARSLIDGSFIERRNRCSNRLERFRCFSKAFPVAMLRVGNMTSVCYERVLGLYRVPSVLFFFFRILLNFTVEAVSTNVWGSGKARCYRGGRWRNTRSTGFRSLTWDFCFGLPVLFGFLFCFSFATATLNGKSAAPTADGLDFGLDLSRAKIGNKHPRRATKQNGNDRAKRAAITQRRERSVLKERNLSSFFSFPFELGRNAPFYGAKSDEATEWRPIKLARNEGKHRRRAERIINAVMASGAEATTSCFLFCFTLKMKWKRRITTR